MEMVEVDKPPYSFDEAFKEWSRIPVDDLGYFSSDELICLSHGQIIELVQLASIFRWGVHQWRNMGNTLVKFMELDRWAGKTVMDYGCGLGMDSLRFTDDSKANVVLADIHPKGLFVAQQVMAILTGIVPIHLCLSLSSFPWFFLPKDIRVDLFWSWGCLHHTPFIADILKRVCQVLTPNGEIRIGLYSDNCWKRAVGLPLPDGPTWKDPRFKEYVKKQDTVGLYADYYTEEKLRREVGDFLDVIECRYIGDGQMLGCVLKPRAKLC